MNVNAGAKGGRSWRRNIEKADVDCALETEKVDEMKTETRKEKIVGQKRRRG